MWNPFGGQANQEALGQECASPPRLEYSRVLHACRQIDRQGRRASPALNWNVARFGSYRRLINERAQTEVSSARRTETPTSFRGSLWPVGGQIGAATATP